MKSFHNNSADEFRPSFGPKAEAPPSTVSAAPAAVVRDFSLGADIWKFLIKEPEIAREWERRLNAELDRVRETAIAEARAQGHAEGLEAGRAQGRAEAASSLEAMKQQLGQTLNALTTEKQSVLQDHSEDFCQAMGHLLTRFFVDGADLKVRAVERWLETMTAELPKEGWTLRVDPESYQRLAVDWSALQGTYPCQLLADASLKAGQIRFSFGTGEMNFSREEQLAKLQTILQPQGTEST